LYLEKVQAKLSTAVALNANQPIDKKSQTIRKSTPLSTFKDEYSIAT